MKKLIILLAVFITCTVNTSAQFHRMAGLSLDYGTYAENFGIGFRYQHGFTEHFRIAPNFTYYFDFNNKSAWNLAADMHYVIQIPDEKLQIYPIVGLDMLSVKYKKGNKGGYSKNGFGGNLGAGIQFNLSDRFTAFGETKYSFLSGSANQLALSVGLGYNF